jgi:hypothetical protein
MKEMRTRLRDAAYVSRLIAHAGDLLGRPPLQSLRRLPYVLFLLLGSVAVLTLSETVRALARPAVQTQTGWLALGAQLCLDWLVALAPAIVLMFLLGEIRSPHRITQVVCLSIGLLCACIIGVAFKDFLLYGADAVWMAGNRREVLADVCAIAFPAALLITIYEFHFSGQNAAEAALRVQADGILKESELSRARLRLLRAQIEPHFIFNSLAHVRRLYEIDPITGRLMLKSLIRYFASALPSLHQETCSLEQEAALITAYLEIHRLRMGSRLAYEVDFPANLSKLQIPTLVLLTLVENSVKHGLSPLPEGGFVRISALQTDDVLALCVADSGRGITDCSGSGTGLANIRARLNTLYGSSAALSLSSNRPRGVTAAVRLPMRQLVA